MSAATSAVAKANRRKTEEGACIEIGPVRSCLAIRVPAAAGPLRLGGIEEIAAATSLDRVRRGLIRLPGGNFCRLLYRSLTTGRRESLNLPPDVRA
jgi:hypothetical protein